MKHAITLMLVLSFAGVACAQKSSDPNKFAVIVNGAGGEAVYAKQFEEWTGQLSSVLSSRFGFDTKQLTVLKGATAEDVKRAFTALKTVRGSATVIQSPFKLGCALAHRCRAPGLADRQHRNCRSHDLLPRPASHWPFSSRRRRPHRLQ